MLLPFALRALNSIAKGGIDNVRAIRESGGVAPIVELLGSADASLVGLAASILAELASCKECCDFIFEQHGIARLVGLLRHESTPVRGEAAHALRSIAFRSATDRDTIRDEGGIAPLGSEFTFEQYEARVLKVLAQREQAEEARARQRERARKAKADAARRAAESKKKGEKR